MSNIDDATRRNLEIIDFTHEFFDIRPTHRWSDVHRHFTKDRVTKFHERIAEIWPKGCDPAEVIPPPVGQFRVVYVADNPRKEAIVRDVIRMSLYASEVLLLDPLQHPIEAKACAEFFQFDTFRHVKLLTLLDPWVRAGIVRLCPNPATLNEEAWLITKMAEQATIEHLAKREGRLKRGFKKALGKNKPNPFMTGYEAAQFFKGQEERLGEYLKPREYPKPWYDDDPPIEGDVVAVRAQGT
jgi:hypothetical protein